MSKKSLCESGTLELWLTRSEPQGMWRIANARGRFRVHAMRMMLDQPCPILDVVHPKVAAVLHSHLDQVEDSAVHSHSDFQLQLPGLILQGLRVLTHVSPDGSASASVRVVHALGDISVFFRAPYGGDVGPDRHLADVAVPVLQDLLMPALELFDHILDKGLNDQQAQLIAARVKTMRARRDQLRDYIGLLTQFIECSTVLDQPQTGPALQHGNDDTHVLQPAHIAAIPQADDIPMPRQQYEPDAALTLPASSVRVGRDPGWSPRHGIVRGDGLGILHGHHSARNRRDLG